jgi:hypothetical protein
MRSFPHPEPRDCQSLFLLIVSIGNRPTAPAVCFGDNVFEVGIVFVLSRQIQNRRVFGLPTRRRGTEPSLDRGLEEAPLSRQAGVLRSPVNPAIETRFELLAQFF